MRSFIDLDRTFAGQPRELGGTLARIDAGSGREHAAEGRAPQLLRQFTREARVASITASSAIEGVIVSGERAGNIAEGSRRFRSRNEREFAGHRDAIDAVAGEDLREPLTAPYVLHLHRLLFQHADGRGGRLKTDQNLIVSFAGGVRRVVFTPPPPRETEFLLRELLVRYEDAMREEGAHPVLLVGALVLDFLAIHPVADGNGRIARLLTMRELLRHGYGVPRYISVEQRIYESKNSYYASLRESQREWHTAEHDVWPWLSYLATTLAGAYDEFVRRIAIAMPLSGTKQNRVGDYVMNQTPTPFRRRDIERAMPEVSQATIRLVLSQLREEGLIEAEGSGPGAKWHRVGERRVGEPRTATTA